VSDTGSDLTTWQQLGAIGAAVLSGLGIGRATKSERMVEAIQQMERTLDERLRDLHTDIKLLLDRGER
jgi:hypothetical protein